MLSRTNRKGMGLLGVIALLAAGLSMLAWGASGKQPSRLVELNQQEEAALLPPLPQPKARPDRVVHVRPGASIQDAVNSLKPAGGTVELAPGIYRENVTLASGVALRAARKGLVTIVPRDPGRETVMGWGVDGVLVENLKIEGGLNFAQEGVDFPRCVSRVVIRGNHFVKGKRFNLVKLSQARDVLIEENEVCDSDGRVGIDLVCVRRFVIRNNDVHDLRSSNGFGIVAKGGSFRGEIVGNRIRDVGNAAISIGQVTDEETIILPDVRRLRFEARGVRVVDNRIGPRERLAILIKGGQDCQLERNQIQETRYFADIQVIESGDTHSPAWGADRVVINQPELPVSRLHLTDLGAHVTFNGRVLGDGKPAK